MTLRRWTPLTLLFPARDIDRYGIAFRPLWRTFLRTLHVVVGFVTAYLSGAYLRTPD